MENIYQDRQMLDLVAKSNIRVELAVKRLLRKAPPYVFVGIAIWTLWIWQQVSAIVYLTRPVIVTLH